MSSFRSKPVGWRYESARHSLAARGYLSTKHDYSINYRKFDGNSGDMVLVGTDRKGRRVRKYDGDHWKESSKEKYGRVWELKKEYPVLLSKIRKDMGSEDESVRKNARVAYVIAKTGMRPGTRKDMRADQKSYGATTLKKSHVRVSGDKVDFDFTGKHGIQVELSERDRSLAAAIKDQKKETTGVELFPHTSDATVRNYLYKYGEYKPKDFRTLKANHIAEKMVKSGAEREEIKVAVSEQLANTPDVSENSYINPSVLRRAK